VNMLACAGFVYFDLYSGARIYNDVMFYLAAQVYVVYKFLI